MKNTIQHIFMIVLLFVGIFVAIYFYSNETTTELRLRDDQIQELKSEIKELKKFSRHTITIGDTTLQIKRDFKVQNEIKEILDIRHIDIGKNSYYVELNSRTGLDLILME